MKTSNQEEIMAGLWAIAAVLAFGFEYPVWGWIFAASAGVNALSKIISSWGEIRAERARLMHLRRQEAENHE